jgi:glycopeptide antibiotics resistance protein
MLKRFSNNSRKRIKGKKKNYLVRVIIYLCSLLCIAYIFYLSWLPNGNLGKGSFLPQWLLDWSNINYNVRTAFPFLALGYLLALNQKVYVAFSVCMIIVCLAEAGQWYLPGRHPDLMDVLYGAFGALIGIGFSKMFHRNSF